MNETLCDTLLSIVSVLAWPLSVVILVVVLRQPLRTGAQRIVDFRLGRASARFNQLSSDVTYSIVLAAVESRPVHVGRGELYWNTLDRAYAALIDRDLNTAVARAYRAVDEWVDIRLRRRDSHELNHTGKPDMLGVVDEAVQRRLLPASVITQVRGLTLMRVLVAGHFKNQLTLADVEKFVHLSDAVITSLERGLKHHTD